MKQKQNYFKVSIKIILSFVIIIFIIQIIVDYQKLRNVINLLNYTYNSI